MYGCRCMPDADIGSETQCVWRDVVRHKFGSRLCIGWVEAREVFTGPVEADEAYFGGKRANMPKAKRKELRWARRPLPA